MYPLVRWYRLDVTALPRGLVILDARAEAVSLWSGPILSVLEALAESLPADQMPDVMFLGDETSYPLPRVLRGLGSQHPRASGEPLAVWPQLERYPVIGPNLWFWLRGPVRPILIVLSGPLIDIEDWLAPPVTEQALVYTFFGTEGLCSPPLRVLDSSADLAQLVEHLRDPVRSVRIGTESALVVDWDNDRYQWSGGILTASSADNWQVTCGVCSLVDDAVRAEVTRASGSCLHLPLIATSAPSSPPPLTLTPAEALILDLWQRNRSYYCTHCGKSHEPGRVQCAESTEPPPLFPSLAGLASVPLLRATRQAGQWLLYPLPRGIALSSDGTVRVARAGEPAVYCALGDRWQPGDDVVGNRSNGSDEMILRLH